LAPTWKCPGRERALGNALVVVVFRVSNHRARAVTTWAG